MAPKRTTKSTPATTKTTTTTFVTDAQLKALIDQGVANALVARDADRSRNGEDNHDSEMGVRRQAPPAHECTYQDFMKCIPLYFKGTKGVVELTQCIERMETVFRISNYTVENQIKLATCTLLGSALMWWNSHVTTVGPDVAYAMTWTNLRKKMTNKYCPRGEIKKLEELALMCARMFPEESDKIESAIELAIECRSSAATNNQRNLTCYECGNQGHYKSDCPKLKNQNHKNHAEGAGAREMVHALGGKETNQDLNNIEDDINA
nr:hypothetical protein [Tanacetum cinerariifolium]